MAHISIAAETLFYIGNLGITNSFLTTYVVIAILTLWGFLVTRRLSLVPSNGQLVAEMIVGGLYSFFESVCGKHIKKFFPLIATLFLFIIVSNWIGLLPGVGTIGFHSTEINAEGHEETLFEPLFRAPTTDLNTTVALSLISVVAIQYWGFKIAGLHYTSRFIDISNPINFFVGLLELISELSKILSFAFRLFGNTFAGEVLLVIISALIQIPLVVPLPIIGLELFVGFIQAFVFAMLTAVFLNIAVSHGAEAHREEVTQNG